MKYYYQNFCTIVIVILILSIPISNLSSQTLTEKDKVDLLISRENYKQALEKIKQLISSDSLDPDIFYKKGVTEQFLYQNLNAVRSFNQALSIDSNNTSYYYAKARSLSAIGFKNEALDEYKIAFKKDPGNTSGALSYSSYLISQEMFDEAGKIYQSLLNYDSLNSNLYSKIAFCYFKVDSLNLAKENYQKAVALNDMDLNDVQQLIVLCIALNKIDLADSILSNKLSKFSNAPSLVRLQGDIFYKKTDYLNAVKYYTEAIAGGETTNYIFPKLALSYFFYANSNDSLSYNDKTIFYEKAKDAFETYLVKDKSNPLVIYYLGVIYTKLGEYNKAASYIGKSLDISIPLFTAEAYEYLAECYRMMKKYDSTAAAYKMSLVFNSDNQLVLDNLFFLYYHTLHDYVSLESYLNEFFLANKDLKEEMKSSIKMKLSYIEKTTSGKSINKPGRK